MSHMNHPIFDNIAIMVRASGRYLNDGSRCIKIAFYMKNAF